MKRAARAPQYLPGDRMSFTPLDDDPRTYLEVKAITCDRRNVWHYELEESTHQADSHRSRRKRIKYEH